MAIIESTKEIEGKTVTIYVEADTVPKKSVYGDQRGAANVIDGVRDVFGEGLELVRNCAERIVEGVKNIPAPSRPDEFQVQLAVKLDSQVGAVIAKTSAGAQLQVTMKWVKSADEGDDAPEEPA